MTNTAFERPFPALTPAQRYHLDVYGYVVIEDVLGAGEIQRLRDELLATPSSSYHSFPAAKSGTGRNDIGRSTRRPSDDTTIR